MDNTKVQSENNEQEKEQENKKKRGLFIILLILLLAAVVAAGIVLSGILSKDEPTDTPENPLPPVDQYIEMLGDEGKPVDVPEGGGSVSMNYTTAIQLDMKSGKISMRYENPSNSSHDVVLELYVVADKDYLIATSGRIPAGAALSQMTMSASRNLLENGSYNAKYRVMYYDAKTGEKALVDANIDGLVLGVKNK